MIAPADPAAPRSPARHVWLPQQHGAWAMLLLPILLGVAASRPGPWQLVVAGAALFAYLASATTQAWARGRRPPAYVAPMLAYGSAAASLGIPLVIVHPALLAASIVVAPAALLVFRGARPGTRRDLLNSLAQVAQALVLVPAVAFVSGGFEIDRVAAYSVVAAGYLVGTVLVVRSVLRERGNEAFARLSLGFHLALVGLAAAALIGSTFPLAYVLLAACLAARAAGLPALQRRLSGTPRPLRPVHVGIVEIVASLAVVVVSFDAPI